ncbi:hypothetical protein C7212DRAFT_340603 [Tuber magnatum]|uniref:Uncharacterized protein n=1 Tax=Tuber magnatum TaxID=42249 RepID=A0A317T029_9PEZI|nr:hypothetical protein C7212DRAFT_340603 [Tuber magnatum]
MTTNKKKEDKGKMIADDSGKVEEKLSWFTPSTEFRQEPLIPLAESQDVDTIENPARPTTSGRYRLKGGIGRGESLGSSSSSARVIDKQKGAQQDLRMHGSEYGGSYKHRRNRSELPGIHQTVGRIYNSGDQDPSTSFGREEGNGDGSVQVPVRRGKGPFCFGDIPLPPTHKIYKLGLGWIPEDEAATFSSKYTESESLSTGVGRSGNSNLFRSKSLNYHTSRSLEQDSNAKSSSSGRSWRRSEGKAPTSSGDTNDKDMPSKSGTSSYLSRPPATPKREHQRHVSKLLENMSSKPDCTSEQVALDYISDYTASDMSSDGPLLTLLCSKVIKESQRCNELTIEVDNLRKKLAIAESQNYISEKAIGELAVELRLMGPRLGLTDAQKLVNRDVAAVLASGGTPPLDITLYGWTYIRVGEPGDSWEEGSYTPIEPFPPGRRRRPYAGDRQPSPTLPTPPKLPSRKGDGGSVRFQPPPERPYGMGDHRLSPPTLSPRKRHTWAGNRRSSPVKSSPPKRLSRGESFRTPLRPVHRHDDASASPGISSSYFNWLADEEEKQQNVAEH